MKKTRLTLFGLMAAATLTASFAASAAEPASPYNYELGLTSHHESYIERGLGGERLMKESANFTGIKGSVGRALGADGYVKATAAFAFGDADYIGSYQGGSYGDLHVGGLNRYLFDTSAVYLHSAKEWNGFALKGGLGYRRLQDNLQEAGPGGYKRINDRVYGIIGAQRTIAAGEWDITPSVEYKHTLWSQQHSDVYGGLNMRQHGNGAEVSIAFAQKGNKFPVTITPFFRTWHVADSETVQGAYEPRNKTNEVGVDLAWRF